MKTLPLALAFVLVSHVALAGEAAIATAHAVQSATVFEGGPSASAPTGANGIVATLNGSTAPIALLQNSGNGVVQNGENVLAQAVACHCAAVADARGTQLARVAAGSAAIGSTNGGNTLSGSFNGSSGMIVVMQNTGSNVAQNAQNVLAIVAGRP